MHNIFVLINVLIFIQLNLVINNNQKKKDKQYNNQKKKDKQLK
jgi:hypothetical protein